MRGADSRTDELFLYVDLQERVHGRHPPVGIRSLVNELLAALDKEFAKLYTESGRHSIAPERPYIQLGSWPKHQASSGR
jgi:hypothetical protein